MTRKPKKKPITEMTTAELNQMAAEFDKEFIADTFGPLSPEARARWEEARAKPDTSSFQTIRVSVEKKLLVRADALAKKLGITRAYLIRRGLKAVLAAEEEKEQKTPVEAAS